MGNEVKKHIKAFATLCSLAMVFSIFSASVLADDPVTGGGNITQATIDDNGGKMPVVGGNYTLADDINVSDTAWIDVSNTNVTIDLAGHKITYSGSGSMYIVGKVTGQDYVGQIDAREVNLTIGDSVGGGKIITGNGYTGGGSEDHWMSNVFGSNTGRGGCILIQNTSSFTFTGGTISGFHADDEGGAIHVSNGSYFYMTGGTITNCTAPNGGAIAVHASTKKSPQKIGNTTYDIAAFARIEGGTITGNTATGNGGGIRALRGNLYLADCVITDNTAANGGGVEISNNGNPQSIQVAGNVQIYGNHASSGSATKADLYLTNNKPTIELAGNLASDAKINFAAASVSTSFDYFKIKGYAYDLDNFICKNSSRYVCYYSANDSIRVTDKVAPKVAGSRVSVGGNIELKPQIDLGSFDDDNASVSYSYSYTKNGKTTTRTNSFTKAQLTKVGSNYEFSIPVESACMTAPIEITITYGTEGDTVTKTVSIEQYVKGMLADTTGTYTQGQKDVAEALLIYGGYAQVQLGIYADQLPDIGVDFSQAYTSGLQGAAYTITKDTNNAYYGVSVSFLTNTEIKMYFKKSVLGDTAPSMVIDGYSEPITAKESGSYYVYVVKGASGNGFPATQYDVSFNFSIGEDISGSYSVETYLKAIKNNDNSSAAMKNLAEAYNNFAQKCIALTTA